MTDRWEPPESRSRPLEAGAVFARCADLSQAGGKPTARLARLAQKAHERLEQPMRLAVAGQTNRGKSTLVNALLGQPVVATGQLELTYTVTEIGYAGEPSLRLRYRDGRPSETFPAGMLHDFTTRANAQDLNLDDILSVELGQPISLLKTFRLVDTPGLNSPFRDDSRTTIDFLGVNIDEQEGVSARRAQTQHDDSVAEVLNADAVLYMFSRAAHERDHAVVTDFLGPASDAVTPLKAFGVLSRCDEYWPPGPDLPGQPDPVDYDPMRVAAKIAQDYQKRPEAARLFFTVVPVSGLVGIGGALLSEEQFGWLADLARLDPPVLARHLSDTARFAVRPALPGVDLPAAHRRELIGQLGGWGIHLACGYLRDKLDAGQVRGQLVADSGVAQLRDLISSHFGNRATVLKREHGVRDLAAEVTQVRLRAQLQEASIPPAAGQVADAMEELTADDHELQELAVLAAHYRGELPVTDDELDEILRVTGEHGRSAFDRLGVPEPDGVLRLVPVATRRLAVWTGREMNLLRDPAAQVAARVIRGSYELLISRAAEAAHLLQLTSSGEESDERA